MRNGNGQKGFGTLLSVLIAMAIVLMLVGAILPNTIRALQTKQEQGAATVLARINFAEVSARQLYSGYMAPSALAASNLTLPMSTCNPGILNPPDAQSTASAGYVITWTPTSGGAPAAGCTPSPNLYTGYSITAAPISKLQGGRYFYTDTTTGLIYMNEGPITAPDPSKIYSINVMGGMAGTSGSSSQNGVGTSLWFGTWQPTTVYPAGAEVEFVVNGSQPELFIDGTGKAVLGISPNVDTTNWFAASTGAPSGLVSAPTSYSGYSTGGLNAYGTSGGNTGNPGEPVFCSFVGTNSGCYNTSGRNPHIGSQVNEPLTAHSFTVSGASNWLNPNGNGGGMQVQFINDATGVVLASCLIVNPQQGCVVNALINIPALASLEIEFQGTIGQTANTSQITWGVQ